MLWLTVIQGQAEAVFWSDNFETNAITHWTTSNVWHIGSPTAGPVINATGFRTHSATNCASTQNYPDNQDARLICTNYNGSATLTVPAASQSPRLRFWHWFNFKYDSLGIYALGFVEIKSGTNDWQQISPTYQKSGGGVWTRPSIDLSAFAGKNVQIAFHFYGGCCGNTLGWYVDDVAIVTNSPVLNAPDSFESGAGDWAVESGTWEIGKPSSGPNAAALGTNCAATILAGNYPNDVDSRLVSPLFPVPTNGPVLRFWHWYNFNNAGGFVEISTNGSTWVQISPRYQNAAITAWTNVSLDLTAYAGKTVQAAFRFGSGGINTAAGWYVDYVTVLAAPVLKVPTTQTIFAGQIFSVTNSATNSFLTNSVFIFSLVSPLNQAVITTNGVLTWTNTAATPGTNLVTIKVTDDSTPPLSATNSFNVIILPPISPALIVSNNPIIGHGFNFSFQSRSNTTWRIDASTNLLDWQPLFTNTVGTSGILQVTDLLATNYLQRFYRAVYP